jgi:excisionase family DNA binding protein
MSETREQHSDHLMTVSELAEELHIGRARAYELVADGHVPSIRLSERRIRIPRHAFEAWLVAQAEVAIDNIRKPRRARKREPETDRPLSEGGGS